jgi:hypothetical protein
MGRNRAALERANDMKLIEVIRAKYSDEVAIFPAFSNNQTRRQSKVLNNYNENIKINSN